MGDAIIAEVEFLEGAGHGVYLFGNGLELFMGKV